MVTQNELKDLANDLAKTFKPLQIILFGSYADGQAKTDSDLDLCIITHLRQQRKIDLMRAIRMHLVKLINHPFDILIYDSEEFEERAKLKSTLAYQIKKEGLTLYGA